MIVDAQKHMTGDKEQFTKLEAKDGGCVTFGDNAKAKIVDIREIAPSKEK